MFGLILSNLFSMGLHRCTPFGLFIADEVSLFGIIAFVEEVSSGPFAELLQSSGGPHQFKSG